MSRLKNDRKSLLIIVLSLCLVECRTVEPSKRKDCKKDKFVECNYANCCWHHDSKDPTMKCFKPYFIPPGPPGKNDVEETNKRTVVHMWWVKLHMFPGRVTEQSVRISSVSVQSWNESSNIIIIISTAVEIKLATWRKCGVLRMRRRRQSNEKRKMKNEILWRGMGDSSSIRACAGAETIAIVKGFWSTGASHFLCRILRGSRRLSYFCKVKIDFYSDHQNKIWNFTLRFLAILVKANRKAYLATMGPS